jgi:hypothetical protein
MLPRNSMAFITVLRSQERQMKGMTTEALTKLLMRACETSTLPLANQAEALGTAYASYLMAKGYPAADLRDFLNRAILVIEDIERKNSINNEPI